MKWYLSCMCLVLEWNAKFFARWMALWLSLYNVPISCSLPSSPINLCNKIISLLASIAATYSASVVESATTLWIFETQLTVVPPTVNTYHVVLLLLSLSPTIFASTYPYREMFEPSKHNDWFVVPFKYLRIHFTAIQCSFLGLFIYLLTTPIACAILGIAQTIIYTKLQAADAYGTLDI